MAKDDDYPEPLDARKPKKRRLQGSCDSCRKKKNKCDSATMPDNFCTNCKTAKIQCTHDLPRQSKKREEIQAYLSILEDRSDRIERYLKFLHPDKDMDEIINLINEYTQSTSDLGQSDSSPAPPTTAASSSTNFSDFNYAVPPLSSKRLPKPSPESAQDDSSEDEDLSHIALSEHVGELSLKDNVFYGPASSFVFAKSALSFRKEMAGVQQAETVPIKRPMLRPWELPFITTPDPVYVFPEYDLLQSLVSLYFERPNILLPVIHKPTFLKSLSAGQHLWDSGFGMTVLMVCAMGARYSNDRRVLQDGDDTWISSGWKWFSQVPKHRNSLLLQTSAYDLQYYCLAITFLLGTTIAQTAWSFLGLGIRFALENGIHRRRGKNEAPSVEHEQLKRAFWCLVCIDRLMSSAFGRPSFVADEDFDIDYPVECDDEYWETEDPEQAFKQPSGIPCRLSAFICHIKLCEILAFALRTLYSTKKSKMLTGLMGVEWEQRLVAELDSSMNKWKDSLPDFLQWRAEVPDNTFFHQSSYLHATYYYVRIQIHRPFLTRRSPLTAGSLATCTSAGRSCCHVLETSMTRGMPSYPHYYVGPTVLGAPSLLIFPMFYCGQIAAFASGIILFLNMWGAHRSGIHVDQTKEMGDIQRCLRVLKECGKRWFLAGRLYYKLNELGSLREYSPTSVPKRPRDALSPTSQTSFAPATNTTVPTTRVQSAHSSRPGTSASTFSNRSSPSIQLHQPHPATANTMHFPQMDMQNPASSLHANNWNFATNVSNTQQQQPFSANPGIAATNPLMLRDGTQRSAHLQSSDLTRQHHGVIDTTRPASVPAPMSDTIASDVPFPLADDVFTVWSDGPLAFNQEEWESYLGGMFARPLDQQ